MTVVVVVIVVAVIVWCLASIAAAVVFGRVVGRANRDAQLQHRNFERHAPAARSAA